MKFLSPPRCGASRVYRRGSGGVGAFRALSFSVAVFAACLAGTAHPAQAARFTGAYLLQLCEKDANGHETEKGGHAACQSYISGVVDYHSVLRSLDIAPRIDICIPDNVSLNTVQDVVLNYLQRHGEHDPFIAAPAVMMALYEVYPCKGKR